jgi:hypothetical protein
LGGLGAFAVLEGSLAAGGGAGATLDVGVAIDVVVLLDNSLTPNPTAKVSIVAPPNSAAAFLV